MLYCLFSQGSRRKDGHGRTEKLGLLTGLRVLLVEVLQGCGLAHSGPCVVPTEVMGMEEGESMNPSLSAGGDSGVCVSQVYPSHT